MKVSVITVVLNGETTIAACVSSVRKQTFSNIEHIIIDGGSVDGTLAILDGFAAPYLSGEDAGIYDAMNKGIAVARGDIIGILNCDDQFASIDVIQKIVDTITSTDCDLCHGKIALINQDGSNYAIVGMEQSQASLLRAMRMAHPSVFARSEVYKKYGCFSVGFKIAADYEFLLRVMGVTKSVYLNEVLVLMGRQGISSVSAVRSRREAMAAAIIHGRAPFSALLDYWKNALRHVMSKALRRSAQT